MPQLKSGRHFGLSFSPLRELFTSGSDTRMYHAILHYRTSVSTAAQLVPLATIGYFDPDGEGPPDGSTSSAGFNARDVLDGKTDWTDDEVEEFRAWLATDRVTQWMEAEFREIDRCIRESPVWQSRLLMEG